jgi:hypothetical protein
MSIDYSASVCYGFIVPRNCITVDDVTEFEYVEEEVLKYSTLLCDTSGDDGQDIYVYAAGSCTYLGPDDLIGAVYLERRKLGQQVFQDFNAIWVELGFDLDDLKLGWIAEFTIS